MNFLNVADLTYYYPLKLTPTLNRINFGLDRGDSLLVMGKSGSGKSTLGKAIAGSVPDFYGGRIKGNIYLSGKPISAYEPYERARAVTMVFQDPESQLMMNKVHREIAFGLENIAVEEKDIKRRVWESMQFSNILNLANRDIGTLSGGEKQKVAITSALSYLPECIVFDEPLSQLDPSASEEIANLIKKINAELGITVIIIEQRISPFFDMADRIAFMNNGYLQFYDSKRDFYDSCGDDQLEFLPDYLKVFKKSSIDFVPQTIKDARKYIQSKNLNDLDEANVKHTKKSDAVISINKLDAYYDNAHIIKNISLKVGDGEFVAIMGTNGAGKSTLLKTLMGLKSYKGNIKILGKEVRDSNTKSIAQNVGYVSQNPNDYISKDTVYDELKFTMDNYGAYDEDAIASTLKSLDIYDVKDQNPHDLSGGQKQRVAIASVLVMKPAILVLDEPTRGIDVYLKGKLGRLFERVNEAGTTILLVTHDIKFSAEYCKRFIIMFDGQIMGDGDISILSSGVYYTTEINKMFRNKIDHIYSVEDAVNVLKRNAI